MIIVLIISFFLESIVSNYINISSNFFIPLFLVTSLVIIFPYFHSEKEYFKMCILFGLLYDIVFTNTLFINLVIFMVIGFITKVMNYYLTDNLFNNLIIVLFNIIFYRFIHYFIIILGNQFSFDFYILIKSIYSSIILNMLYGTILFIILKNKHKFSSKRYW